MFRQFVCFIAVAIVLPSVAVAFDRISDRDAFMSAVAGKDLKSGCTG